MQLLGILIAVVLGGGLVGASVVLAVFIMQRREEMPNDWQYNPNIPTMADRRNQPPILIITVGDGTQPPTVRVPRSIEVRGPQSVDMYGE